MSLVVVDSDEAASSSLQQQLSRLEYTTIPAADLSLALDICDHALPELLISRNHDWALDIAARHRRLPVVYAAPGKSRRKQVLESLRGGLADVWDLPATDEFLADRIVSILGLSREARSQSEARLSEHVADLQRDQRAGRYIQMGMLPPNPMAIDQYRLHHRIIPSLILSGDFVDYFRITERHFAFYIADVSGHGASSAFVTVLLKNFSRRLRREYRPTMLNAPGEILEWINRELLEQKIDKHVAMILAVGDLEDNSVSLVNAGHFPPAILVNASGVGFVEQRGKPVGLFDKVKYDARVVRLDVGDRLVMFSDGLLDAMDNESLSEKEERLLQAAVYPEMDLIWQSLGINEGAVPDDMTCLTVRRER